MTILCPSSFAACTVSTVTLSERDMRRIEALSKMSFSHVRLVIEAVSEQLRDSTGIEPDLVEVLRQAALSLDVE